MDTSSIMKSLESLDGSYPPELAATLSSVIADAMLEGDSVAIPGFGTFEPEKVDEHVVRDNTGARILVPPSIMLNFKTSVVLRNKLK